MPTDDIHHLTAAVEHAITRERYNDDQAEDTRVLMRAIKVLLLATNSLGECRRSTPFSQLRPVIDEKGVLKWCCNHSPEHCAS